MKALDRLREILGEATPAVVAVSGGLDSRFLAQAAWRWGFEALPLFFDGPQQTPGERAWVRQWAASENRTLHIVHFGPLDLPQAATNARDRCYHCKLGLYGRALEFASGLGLGHVLDGSNASDLKEFRPGLQALVELGIRRPLAGAGLGRRQISQTAAQWGLARPEQPSRSCLMTRFPYGHAPERDELEHLGLAEDALAGIGFGEYRLRQHVSGEYVLQLGREEAGLWESQGSQALRGLKVLGVEPMRVVFGERVSGYFD